MVQRIRQETSSSSKIPKTKCLILVLPKKEHRGYEKHKDMRWKEAAINNIENLTLGVAIITVPVHRGSSQHSWKNECQARDGDIQFYFLDLEQVRHSMF